MIELIKFRIKNYRSIIDSDDCYLANKITVLAGKNESGKSSILEALGDFDTEKEISKSTIPINNENSKPEIIITFKVGKDTINEIMHNLNFNINFDRDMEITITKIYPKKYSLHEDFLNILDIDSRASQVLSVLVKRYFPSLNYGFKEMLISTCSVM